jgi:hypothetical protein
MHKSCGSEVDIFKLDLEEKEKFLKAFSVNYGYGGDIDRLRKTEFTRLNGCLPCKQFCTVT